MVDEIGGGPDLDSLGTDAASIQLKWTPTDYLEFNIRHNWMKTDRIFGGADGGGLTVLNEKVMASGKPTRWFPDIAELTLPIPILPTYLQNNYYDASSPILTFNDPNTGAPVLTQCGRAGIDYGDYSGFQNAAASLDGFNSTSAETAARYNDCVFDGDINGDDNCAATNGGNWEEFEQEGTQLNLAWDVTDTLQLKYLYGHSDLSYERITDDDNTAGMIHDRTFYVNHEARYESHELQAFYEFGDNLSFTSGIFFYDAQHQSERGSLFCVGEARYSQAYEDNTPFSGPYALGAAGTPESLTRLSFAARDSC